jgi:hypothetical protein
MGQSPIQLDNTSLDPQCAGRRYWYAFLMSSLITFFGGVFVISIWRIFHFIFIGRRWTRFKHEKSSHLIEQAANINPEIGWVTSIKDFAGELISGLFSTLLFGFTSEFLLNFCSFLGKSKTGRVLVIFLAISVL